MEKCPLPERSVDLCRIKTDNDRTVDDGHWGGHVSKPLKLLDSSGVLGHIPFLKRNLFLRKILFRPVAEHSTWLREYSDGFRHRPTPLLELLPDPSCAQFRLVRSPAGATGSNLAVNRHGWYRADPE